MCSSGAMYIDEEHYEKEKAVMELYKVPRNSRIKVVGDIKVPPASPMVEEEEILNFRSIDGMYSYCTRDNGEVVHLAAWTEVEIV